MDGKKVLSLNQELGFKGRLIQNSSSSSSLDPQKTDILYLRLFLPPFVTFHRLFPSLSHTKGSEKGENAANGGKGLEGKSEKGIKSEKKIGFRAKDPPFDPSSTSITSSQNSSLESIHESKSSSVSLVTSGGKKSAIDLRVKRVLFLAPDAQPVVACIHMPFPDTISSRSLSREKPFPSRCLLSSHSSVSSSSFENRSCRTSTPSTLLSIIGAEHGVCIQLFVRSFFSSPSFMWRSLSF